MDQKSQQAESVLLAAESQRIVDATPDLDILKSETSGAVDRVVDGERRVYYRHPGLTQAENEANGKRVSDMMSGRVKASREVAFERESRASMVAVRGPDGGIRHIPADNEHIAARKQFKPIIKWGRPKWRKRESEYRKELNDAASEG